MKPAVDSRRRRSPVPTALLALTVSVLSPALLDAQRPADDAFKRGIEALEREQWNDAAAEMLRAIKADDKETTRKVGGRLGFGGREYFPHFYRGQALSKLGDCAGAVVEWSLSEQQGAVRSHREYYANLQQGYKECESKGVLPPSRFDPLVERTRGELAVVTGVMAKVKQLGDEHIEIWRADRTFADQYAKAAIEYDRARDQFEKSQQSRLERDFDAVTTMAERSTRLLQALGASFEKAVAQGRETVGLAADVQALIDGGLKQAQTIDARRGMLSPSEIANAEDGRKKLLAARQQLAARPLTDDIVSNARATALDGMATIKQVISVIESRDNQDKQQRFVEALNVAKQSLTSAESEYQLVQSLLEQRGAPEGAEIRKGLDEARKQLDGVTRRLGSAEAQKQLPGVQAANRAATQVFTSLKVLEATFGPIAAEEIVPRWLQTGVDQYFKGAYARALDELGNTSDAGPAQLHVHLFRAAALYALYVRSGEKDTGKRDQAVTEVRRSKQLNPTFVPDASAFSPAFLEFYQKEGVSAPQVSRAQ